MKKTVFALTGATGLLGRNVLFEIIKDHLTNLNSIEIIIFGRPSKDIDLANRIYDIYKQEGINYLSPNEEDKVLLDAFFKKNVVYVNIDLLNSEFITNEEKFKVMGREIDHFLHIAASTDFRDDKRTVESLYQQNVLGTAKILNLCTQLPIASFGYVSSAYACGKTYGDIQPDYTNIEQEFRNPYEKTKLKGEILVKQYEKQTGVRCRIFRPSTISGKLIEDIKGEVSKFDVFYGWAAFFLRWKMKKHCNAIETLYEEPVSVTLRVAMNQNAGLNIVPADFAAKVLYKVCKQDVKGDYFHLVNNQETPNPFYISRILELMNFSGFTFVDEIPTELNALEAFYYKSIGSIFSPYLIQDEIKFNTDNLQDLFKSENLHCPEINEENMQILLKFAQTKNFGIKLKQKAITNKEELVLN